MEFDVIIDTSLFELGINCEGATKNEFLVTLVNDFEDGNWRFEKFQNFVWDNISETALSVTEREALESQPASLLTAAAKNLRLTDSDNDFGKGSELAEIVLYGIMKHKYGALPVVPKIFYKQNVQDNAKGADSVHIVLEGKDGFSLWFGEAKFYSSIEDVRLDAVIGSVANSLAKDKLKKENSIITNVSDLDNLDIDDGIRENIKSALAPKNSIDTIKPLLNVPILLLHECNITATTKEYTKEYRKAIADRHMERAEAYFKKQIVKLRHIHKCDEIRFDLILFPVPKKSPIVDKFVSNVGQYKG